MTEGRFAHATTAGHLEAIRILSLGYKGAVTDSSGFLPLPPPAGNEQEASSVSNPDQPS